MSKIFSDLGDLRDVCEEFIDEAADSPENDLTVRDYSVYCCGQLLTQAAIKEIDGHKVVVLR